MKGKEREETEKIKQAGTDTKDPGLFDLFFMFLKLGLFTIGGGMAMVPLMQGLMVDKKRWLTEEEMVDCLAVSQGLPGVIAINMATYIGYKKRRMAGALISTVGVIIPSLCIIIAVVELLGTIRNNPIVDGALLGVKAAATGLIVYAVYSVGRQVIEGVFPAVLAVLTFVAVAFGGVNAVMAILAGAILGVGVSRYKAGREGDDI